jgi:type IV secretion system protein TrbL
VIRIFNVGSGYQARKTTKTAWLGAVLIVTWYWIGVTVLSLVNGFTIALLPELSALLDVLQGFTHVTPSNTGLTLLLAFLGGVAMWALEALLYIREVLLYVYLYGMPIAIAVAYGNVPVISRVASGFCRQFIPLAIMPLPAALVFKGYDLLYANGAALTPNAAFLKTLVAVSLPLLALYITWTTFRYATPLTAKTIGTATKGTALLGGVAVASYVGGAGVARTAARWGPKAAAGHAVAQGATSQFAGGQRSEQSAQQSTTESSVDETSQDRSGIARPTYRRTENDPGIY